MADASLFVHKCARDAHVQITRLSDFVSPTIVAMWNLRWQVQGFVHARPDATQEDLVSRFALGSEVRGNEIRRACIENSWDEQRARFAALFLTNTIAIFEEFLDGLTSLSIADEKAARVAAKALQYPVAQSGRNYTHGYAALGAVVPSLDGVFKSPAGLGRWYSGSKIQNLLLCYRFFKEVRNSGVHNGGKATQSVMDAYASFQPVANKVALNIKEVPVHAPPILNQPILLDLRGAYGFSDIVMRLIATYDRDLSDRAGALADISGCLGKLTGHQRTRTTNSEKKERAIQGLLQRAQLPKAVLTREFKVFLKKTDRIPDYW